MTPEIYAAGFMFAIIGGLLGIIWKQLNSRLDKKDKSDIKALEVLHASIKEDISVMSVNINARIGEHSNRLNSGSNRMDMLQKEISDHKVKIAEQYHSAEETRTLIADLIRPLEMMMNGIRADIITLLTREKRND
jgi:hypothetical protein